MSNTSGYVVYHRHKITTTKKQTLFPFLAPMASVSKYSIKSQTKSISLPCRSHPTTFEIEELLSNIKTTVAEASSAEAICNNLSQLTGLYKCMNNLLASSTTQVLMSQEQNKKWVNELVDESVRFLDICGSISEMLSEIKDHSIDLVCALRRRMGDHLIIENSIMKYNCFRKKLRKHVKGLNTSLKQVDNLSGGGSAVVDSDNHHLAAVIRAIIGVSEMTILGFESLLMFFSASVSKPNRWSIVVSKIMHKEMVACEDQKENGSVNEFGNIDAALKILCKFGFCSEKGNHVQIAQCRLERVGAHIERMESGLECIFRFLVQIRVSLLNIISQ
ncbi:hypothetical protein HanRHA438_Chr07g0305061 [Helianthus annuus]|uniref:DUF241 domain protein n=2 Tax=Helianthus annuus TaxID=4232 RepID=A0A9K3NFS4_HELAN|nr:hypothetical protein HanXRQr2_Chr07g0294871 [Helianthus annuus]KAJ0550184.1 hypothetical protein HanHA300_Chr07g0242501 [Helianthus annuus]KAJ0563140.1 hypothetical protein HanHA89_Chr07g0259711 [Helianthus annuus]KAJ0728507.1 hypothetical protein HanLR1_Chr07g0242391 [Helianthus annuus]KAJ0731258.1 hypothetical protein HanOQP8_Chr07g0249891 [Helianthus annuus]